MDANGLMLGPRGRLWVPDARNRRMSVFDPEDGFIESFPFADGFCQELGGGYMADSIPFYASEVRYIDRRGVFWSSRDGDQEYRFQRWHIRPAVEDIFESDEGNLWVRTPAADGGVLFDVHSRDGAHLGTASLGPGLNLFDRVAPGRARRTGVAGRDGRV